MTNTTTATLSMATHAPTVREAAATSSTLSKASPVTAKANVARKTPNAIFVIAERTNVRMTRGDSCELASWSPTRVIAKTTPTKVSIDDAITCSIVSAVRIRTTRPRSQSVGSPSRSGLQTTTAVSTPASTRTAGIDQNRSRTHSLHRTNRYAKRGPGTSARTWARDVAGTTMRFSVAAGARRHHPAASGSRATNSSNGARDS